MTGEPCDVVPRLRLDLLGEFLLRVRGAREGEVLPHQNAPLVAELVEVGGLVDAPAPDAQQVRPAVDGLLDALPVALPAHSRDEDVVRDPVHTADEHVSPVDPQPEGVAGGVGGGVDGDRPQSEATGPAIQELLPRQELHLGLVQRLLAVADRPPETRIGHVHPHHGVGVMRRELGDHLLAGEPDEQSQGFRRRVAGPLDRDVELHRRVFLGRLDHQRPHGVETSRAPRLQADRPPDPGGDEVRAPVPAEVAGRLPDGVERVRVHVRPRAATVDGLRVLDGGSEGDPQLVGPCPQAVRDVESVAPVLVDRAAELLAVQHDGGDGVEAVEDEHMPVGGRAVPLEDGRVAPIGAADPGQPLGVGVEERVGDRTVGEQVGVHDAGNRRREDTAAQLAGTRSVHGGHGPPRGQLDGADSAGRAHLATRWSRSVSSTGTWS